MRICENGQGFRTTISLDKVEVEWLLKALKDFGGKGVPLGLSMSLVKGTNFRYRLEVTGEPYILCYLCCGAGMRRGPSSQRENRRGGDDYS